MMDEMKIKLGTQWMRGIVSKIAEKVISKKLGIKPKIQLHEISIEKKNGKIQIHINADAEIKDNDLIKITRLATMDEEETD